MKDDELLELWEAYKRKIVHIEGMINAERSIIEVARLKVKLGCYRAFVLDLERAISAE